MDYHIIIYILLFNHILLSVNSSAVNDDAKEPQYCQWDPPAVSKHAICLERCSKKKGFIHSVKGEFLCSNEHEKPGNPKPSKSKTVEGMYDCTCEHPFKKEIVCNPQILYVNVSKEQCEEICGRYFVLIYVQNNTIEAYCEEASSVKLFDLEAVTLSVLKPRNKNNTRGFSWSKICKCGVNLDPEIEKKKSKENLEKIERKKIERKYSRSLAQLEHLCTVQKFLLEFALSTKELCERKCSSAKAFLDSSNELICYHERRPADVISSKNEDCQCGAKINRSRKDGYKLPCFPNQPVEKIPASHCGIVCNNLSVYIFQGKETRILTYCDLRKDPPEGFERLEPQIKRYKKPSPSRRYELPCSCGVNTSSSWKKQNTNGNSSTFEATNSQRNMRNFYEKSSSSQPVTNPIITPDAKINASPFPTATNHVSGRDMVARDGAYEGIINVINISDLYKNSSLLQAATKQVPETNLLGSTSSSATYQKSGQLSFRGGNPSKAVPKTKITQNPNVCASYAEAVQNPIRAQEPNGCASSSGAVQNLRTAQGPNRWGGSSDAIRSPKIGLDPNRCAILSSEAVKKPRTAQNPNEWAGSSGEIANRGITPNVYKNVSCYFLSATNRLSEHNSVRNSSSSQAVLHRRNADIPPFDGNINEPIIDDNVPVEDRNIPSQFGQLPQSSSPADSNTFVNCTLSLSRRESFANERTSYFDPKNTNNDDGDNIILKDVPTDYSPSLAIRPQDVVTSSDHEPVADINYPTPYYHFL